MELSAPAAVLSAYDKGNPAAHLTYTSQHPRPPCPPDSVIVRLEYAPIHPSDVNICQGTYLSLPSALPSVVGNEGSGVIVEIGSDVASLNLSESLSVGDVVFAVTPSWQRYAVVPASRVRKFPTTAFPPGPSGPPKDALVTAAFQAINPPTAYGLLAEWEASGKGWVIQNAANSAVGLAVIRVAALRRIPLINIVRSDAAASAVSDTAAAANVPSNIVVFAGDSSAAPADAAAAAATALEAVRRLTIVPEDSPYAAARGKVTLALNAVCGPSGELLGRALSAGGTHLTYGVMGRAPMSVAGGQLLFKGLTYRGWHLGGFLRATPKAAVEEMWRMLLTGGPDGSPAVPPPPHVVRPLSEVAAAVTAAAVGTGPKFLLAMDETT
eukprot:TRINITY_DN59978_c0_g1_i1.p1 TRINITY_DN59978_c0_g1~~TRINITY_DN59978_c0_g1_i1.p1  ORF type:complete len:382 (+),score=62.42 TRINITY_DN59978_c0_g1_i1:71-1216(+)